MLKNVKEYEEVNIPPIAWYEVLNLRLSYDIFPRKSIHCVIRYIVAKEKVLLGLLFFNVPLPGGERFD